MFSKYCTIICKKNGRLAEYIDENTIKWLDTGETCIDWNKIEKNSKSKIEEYFMPLYKNTNYMFQKIILGIITVIMLYIAVIMLYIAFQLTILVNCM